MFVKLAYIFYILRYPFLRFLTLTFPESIVFVPLKNLTLHRVIYKDQKDICESVPPNIQLCPKTNIFNKLFLLKWVISLVIFTDDHDPISFFHAAFFTVRLVDLTIKRSKNINLPYYARGAAIPFMTLNSHFITS